MIKIDKQQNSQFLQSGNPPPKNAGLFGSQLTCQQAKVLMLSCPWEGAASSGLGTSLGPKNILTSSHQLDLEDPLWGKPYQAGLVMDLSLEQDIQSLNMNALSIMRELRNSENFKNKDKEKELTEKFNAISKKVNQMISDHCYKIFDRNKIPCLVGGDHSLSWGLVDALAKTTKDPFSVLHLDAHFDLRKAYEGLTYSHASIMYNLWQDFPQIEGFTQVGIRDFCHDEWELVKNNKHKFHVFLDRDLASRSFQGESFSSISQEIIATLGQRVYLSLDVDALTPDHCPNTGTPVPGGLYFNQVVHLLETLVASGREIICFDLVEVAGGDSCAWDGNVGARLLYQLCGALLKSQK